MNQEALIKWQSIASILASIAIPLILAIVGYFVQDKMSSEGLRKDYVQIAISILKERQDEELRKWAVNVLDENSPIPFSKGVRTKLEKGIVFVPVAVACSRFPDPPEAATRDPGKWLIETEKQKLLMGDLKVDDVIKNYERCDRNAIDLETLQKWLRAMQASDRELHRNQAAGGNAPNFKDK